MSTRGSIETRLYALERRCEFLAKDNDLLYSMCEALDAEITDFRPEILIRRHLRVHHAVSDYSQGRGELVVNGECCFSGYDIDYGDGHQAHVAISGDSHYTWDDLEDHIFKHWGMMNNIIISNVAIRKRNTPIVQ